MFRTGLLFSTAMTAVALLLSGAPAEAYARTNVHVASHDPNTRFLCTYGHFLVSASYHASDSSVFNSWQHVAVHVRGRGQTVTSIKVVEAQSAHTSSSGFKVGIYSTNASGFPGKPLAVGTGRARPTCGQVTVSIPPTTLTSGKKYWIEETVVARHNGSPTNLYWEAKPNTGRKAYVQYHRFSHTSGSHSSYTSPWRKRAIGPYVRLR